MATYKIKGARWLRKYTAGVLTPAAYSASTDAATIADTMCRLAWEKSAVTSATMTSHSTEEQTRGEEKQTGLDWNVVDREYFDAAVWCAEHSGGAHRAYGQAACYKFTLPDMATYPNITEMKLVATSDPYNKSGLRIHFVTSDTGEIPTDCATCRNNDSTGAMITDGTSAKEKAKRTTNAAGTKAYANTETVTLTPTDTVALKKYLLVFVMKENYAESNGEWLDGSGFIRNEITITTSGEVTGWTDGGSEEATLDEEDDGDAYAVVDRGATPEIGAGVATGRRTLVSEARGAHGLHAAYRTMLEGGGEAETTPDGAGESGQVSGACWRVRQTVKGWEIESAVETIPLVLPRAYEAVKMAFDALNLTSGAKYRVFLKAAHQEAPTEEDLKLAALWDGIGETGEWTLLGEIASGTTAKFALGDVSGVRYATLMVVAYMAPDAVDATESVSWQGTGESFRPKVELV